MPVYPATLQHIPVPMAASQVLTWGKQLKASLEQVHSKGYGHNDIKAANVFLTSKGEQQQTPCCGLCIMSYLAGKLSLNLALAKCQAKGHCNTPGLLPHSLREVMTVLLICVCVRSYPYVHVSLLHVPPFDCV